MKKNKIKSIPLYSEGRECLFPTAALIKDSFQNVSVYEYEDEDGTVVRDKLNNTQKEVLELIGINEQQYWSPKKN